MEKGHKTEKIEKKYKSAKGFFKKNLYYFIMGGALLTAALVITLVLTLGGKPVIPIDPEPDVPAEVQPVTFIVPVENGVLGKGYSETTLVWNATLRQWETHTALDFKAPSGSQVLAAYDGTVESVADTILDGTVITLAHKDGLKTVYKSLDSAALVEEGQKVTTGQPIGTVSASQIVEKKEGAHLHFEVLLDGEEVDPLAYMPDLADK